MDISYSGGVKYKYSRKSAKKVYKVTSHIFSHFKQDSISLLLLHSPSMNDVATKCSYVRMRPFDPT